MFSSISKYDCRSFLHTLYLFSSRFLTCAMWMHNFALYVINRWILFRKSFLLCATSKSKLRIFGRILSVLIENFLIDAWVLEIMIWEWNLNLVLLPSLHSLRLNVSNIVHFCWNIIEYSLHFMHLFEQSFQSSFWIWRLIFGLILLLLILLFLISYEITFRFLRKGAHNALDHLNIFLISRLNIFFFLLFRL